VPCPAALRSIAACAARSRVGAVPARRRTGRLAGNGAGPVTLHGGHRFQNELEGKDTIKPAQPTPTHKRSYR